MQWVYDRYFFNVIPKMASGWSCGECGGQLSIFVESIRKFPDQERFAAMIRTAVFAAGEISNIPLRGGATFGVWKI